MFFAASSSLCLNKVALTSLTLVGGLNKAYVMRDLAWSKYSYPKLEEKFCKVCGKEKKTSLEKTSLLFLAIKN